MAELKAFDASARAGGMSAAARAIGLTQPTLTAHVLALERRFGVELFVRRGRMLELTEFGRLLQEITHRIWRAEEAAAELLFDARSQFQGRLSIVAVGPYNVTPMLVRFRARWPNVRLAVGVGDSREIVEHVLDRRGDLGVLVHSVRDPRIHCVPYRRQRLVLLVPRAHPLARRRAVRLADLQGLEFVMREEGSTRARGGRDGQPGGRPRGGRPGARAGHRRADRARARPEAADRVPRGPGALHAPARDLPRGTASRAADRELSGGRRVAARGGLGRRRGDRRRTGRVACLTPSRAGLTVDH
jgi:DNA-binding transcriptional LysR family regulator